jgi:putative oxidoreductase
MIIRNAALRAGALLPLRVMVGYGFLAHGIAKGTRGPAGFARLLDFVGVPFPLFTSWMVTLLEIFGGLALIAGVLVTLASIPLIVSMLVAMLTVHLRYGFSSVNTVGMSATGPLFGPPGYEINLLYITALTALALHGAGPLSFDAWRSRKWRRGVDDPIAS